MEEEKRAKFQFGKRDGADDEEEKRKFQFGKRIDNDDVSEMDKKKFQFGKREDLEDEEMDKRKFQFGKRKFQFGKRKFQFGKREDGEDEDIDKRKFQFGKRKFQFGKREDGVNFDKRKFQFGKRKSQFEKIEDEENDNEKRTFQFGKRKFQFGKRNDKDAAADAVGLDDQINEYKRKFEFGKRKFQLGKRKFQFGKRDLGESEAFAEPGMYLAEESEKIEKKPFGSNGYRLNKRSVDYLTDLNKRLLGNNGFQFGDRYLDDDSFDEYVEKRPFGSSSFKFGERTYDFPRENWVLSKRLPVRRYQQFRLPRNGRKFLLGKRFEDDVNELQRDLKRKKIELDRRAFGSNVYHWKTGKTDFTNYNSELPLGLSYSDSKTEKRAFGGGVNNLFG